MPRRNRAKLNATLGAAAGSVVCGLLAASPASAQSAGNRILGLDISAHQGIISQTTWDDISNVENRKFVIVRASRGGTTGEDHRQGGYPAGDNTFFNLSQRYDDPYFIQNVQRATAAGMFVGTYHRSRADVIASTPNSGGIANTGIDDANHFIQMAGPWMRPGYLPPVHDFEDGDGIRTDAELAQFALDFGNRIYAVMQVRPMIYVNGNYANSILADATVSASIKSQLAQQPSVRPTTASPTYPQLWSARWPAGSGQQYFGDVQNEHPKDTVSSVYGIWDDYGITQPWAFWQYASGGRLQSFNNGTQNLDFDIAQGGMEFVKDQLIPALWWNDSSGDWSTLANWNSGQTPVAPPASPGQLTPTATGPLPTPRLPGAAVNDPTTGLNDTVILERPNANITVTLSTGSHDIRKLYMREALNITGGSLNINYVPVVPESSAMSAQISGPLTLGGTGALSVHTMWIDATRSLTLSGGTLTFNTIDLKQASASAAGSILVTGNATIAALPGITATINSSAGPGGSGAVGVMNLSAGNRTITIPNGTADVDLAVNVPITNGQLTKSGTGTVAFGATNTFTGAITLNDGIVRVSTPAQLNGVTSVVSNITVTIPGVAGHGGTLQLIGSNTYNVPMTINGAGLNGVSVTPPGATGALDNLTGTNTWAGAITLGGSGTNGTDPTINQISGANGTSLVLSGVIQNAALTTASLAKSGHGEVVLTGASPNTYSGLTRVYGGRLVIEKDGALGTAGSATLADGNTFQLGGTANTSTIAFRAPGASSGFHYATSEWINLDGVGYSGGSQLENLGGTNTFSGHLGLNGPSGAASIGITAGSLELKGGIFTRGVSGARTLTKTGVGTLIISGDTAATTPNTLNGSLTGSTFTMNQGTTILKGTAGNTANVPGFSAYNVNSSILALGKSGAAGTGTITLSAGTLRTDASLTSATPLVISSIGGGTLDSLASTSTFTGALSGAGALGKSGAGRITVTGGVSGFSGALTINQGTLAVGANGGNSGTLGVATLSINPAATLDLADNDLIVNSGTFSAVKNLVLSGFGTSGPGIISSTSDGTQILALFDNALVGGADWNGQTIAAGAIVGKYTFFGDVNFDGQVTGDDYTIIDSNLNTTPPVGMEWLSGDANLDGIVTGDDYTTIDSNLGLGAGNPLSPNSLQPVPEPSALAALIVGAGCLIRRRRS